MGNKVIRQQNNCINFIKGCACFGILYMHTSYDFFVSSILTCLFRFAVLIFFMISGYYCFNNDRMLVEQKMPKKIKHILKLSLISIIIYFIWGCILFPLFNGANIDLISYCRNIGTIRNFINFIIFNQVPFGGILWFLFALLYCYLIFFWVNKKNWYNCAYALIPILIVIHIVSRGIIQYFNIIDEQINIVFYRNFIFMGFPFFMLGNFIHKYEEKITKKFSNKMLLIFAGLGLVLSCVERRFVALELFWGTVIATFCIFILAVKNSEKKIIPFIATLGEKYSMQIYIVHPIISQLIYIIKTMLGLQNNIMLAIINPIIVLLVIVGVIKLYYFIKIRILLAQ